MVWKAGHIPEVSGVSQPLPLCLEGGALQRVQEGAGLTLQPAWYVLRSEGPATKIHQALCESGELILEAWVTPASLDQRGPARIVSLPLDTGLQRNLTLEQEGPSYRVRLRLSPLEEEGAEAKPQFEIVEVGTPSGVVPLERHQVAVTYATCPHCGVATLRIFVNGESVLEHPAARGDFRTWEEESLLLVGNEGTLDRSWFGTLSRVDSHRRALSAEEVRQNFEAGP